MQLMGLFLPERTLQMGLVFIEKPYESVPLFNTLMSLYFLHMFIMLIWVSISCSCNNCRIQSILNMGTC